MITQKLIVLEKNFQNNTEIKHEHEYTIYKRNEKYKKFPSDCYKLFFDFDDNKNNQSLKKLKNVLLIPDNDGFPFYYSVYCNKIDIINDISMIDKD